MPELDDLVPDEPPARGVNVSILERVEQTPGQWFRALLTTDKKAASDLTSKLRNSTRTRGGEWDIAQRTIRANTLDDVARKELELEPGDKAYGVWVKRIK